MTDADKLAVLRYRLALLGTPFILRSGDTLTPLDPAKIAVITGRQRGKSNLAIVMAKYHPDPLARNRQ